MAYAHGEERALPHAPGTRASRPDRPAPRPWVFTFHPAVAGSLPARPAPPGTPLKAGSGGLTTPPPAARGLPAAVLFDRDGTLVEDVPHNDDPARVRPMATASAALRAARSAGVPVGIVTNQPGIGRGLLTPERFALVQRRVEGLLGPFDVTAVCPHAPPVGCDCRKPAPGLVEAACRALGADPRRSVVIGDIGKDMEAAGAAGARGVLVPTPLTLPGEVAAAPETTNDLLDAVRRVLERPRNGGGP